LIIPNPISWNISYLLEHWSGLLIWCPSL
jgi:hypothetical protein